MDRPALRGIARQYGTPAFIFDEDMLRARVNAMREIIGRDIRLTYSIKANPFLIPALRGIVDDFEVCSPGEFHICRDEKLPPECILLSGVNKCAEDIAFAVQSGVRRFTAESLKHVALICAAAEQADVKLEILPRLNAGTQFGMSKEDFAHAVNICRDNPNVSVTGIHYFAGTQRVKEKNQEGDISNIIEFLQWLEVETGHRLTKIEYGPGLPFPYFVRDDFSDTLSPLKLLAPKLRALSEQYELTVEMGRFIASECGYYLTTVEDTKACEGVNYAIIDGGIHHINYLGGNMGMRQPVIELLDRQDGECKEWMLCGSLCTTADVVVRKLDMPLGEGSVLAFCNIGAYSVTESPNLFLSRDMPRVLTYSDGKARLVRDKLHTYRLNH